MALEKKKAATKKITIKDLVARIDLLEERLAAVEQKRPANGKSINKVETFNGEKEPSQQENMRMDKGSKLQSAKNAVKILPPNMVVDGRHLAINVGAICGFVVTEEMMDEIYK